MWSGPRNLSTAMMRSFGNRSDTFVSDEPFYGAYLRDSGAPHPMREEVMAAMDCGWESVARTLSGPCPGGQAIWYQKHMSHHMIGPVGFDDLAGFTHAFLIREPARMIASYLRARESAAFEDLGLDRQADIFAREADRLGRAPPVVDAADLLSAPEPVLASLCGALGIPYDAAMLAWPAGRRSTDGIWASHWYAGVDASTGFGPPETGSVTLDSAAARLADRCRPYYERLAAHRLRPG
ncbi:MAG: Branched-chain amino acid aminotransferase [Alphaproteobacteria bacterium]|nr:Branched-chain amino acid aminotransferase [Alphaproteobacteria bacterium]